MFDETELKINKEENLEDYLFAYNYIQSNYSTQELNDFFERIKQNYYADQKNKIKTK